MKRLTALIAAVVGIAFSAGCGQSGSLYLPGDPSEVRQAPLPTGQTSQDEEEEADESR